MSSDRHSQQAAFDTLLKPHLERLYRLAFRLTGQQSDAEDLLQEVLLKTFQRLDELADVDDPGPWLSKVLYHRFIDNQRRFKRQRLSLAELGAEQDARDSEPHRQDGTLAAASTEDHRQVLADALDMLSEEHQLVVLLHDAEGYTLPQIQALTDIPLGTCKSRLHRARARLRDILRAQGTFFED